MISVGPPERSPRRDRTVRPLHLWDLDTKKLALEIRLPAAADWPVGFSRDGTRFVTRVAQYGGVEKTAITWEGTALWDASTGQHACSLPGCHAYGHAFSPDGAHIAFFSGGGMTVCHIDTCARAGEKLEAAVTRPEKEVRLRVEAGKAPAANNAMTDDELDRLWSGLASDDAAKAYRAMWSLALAPKSSLPLLRERLKPAAAPKPERLARLLADLDSDSPDVRQKARTELNEVAIFVAADLPVLCAISSHSNAENRRENEGSEQ